MTMYSNVQHTQIKQNQDPAEMRKNIDERVGVVKTSKLVSFLWQIANFRNLLLNLPLAVFVIQHQVYRIRVFGVF